MKFTKLFVLLFAVVAFASCKKEEEKPVETIETNTNTIEKETVIVKDTVKVEETKGTSVKVNSNGVEVESKSVDVEVKK